MPNPKTGRPPVALIIDDQEWSTRSVESILAPNGFAVMRAYTGRKGIERATVHRPDVIIVDANLVDVDGFEVCRALRSQPAISDLTPILISSSERLSRQDRLKALRSGAWDVLTYPIDAEELVARLEAYSRAKVEADRLADSGLVDPRTGLYNLQGLERRASELSAWAYRENGAVACVVFGPSADGERSDAGAMETAVELAAALRRAGRVSDVIGRLGQNEFAVLAPSTDGEGAVKLAERLALAVREHAEESGTSFDLRGGFDAVERARETPAGVNDLLRRATLALRRSRSSGKQQWLESFETAGETN